MPEDAATLRELAEWHRQFAEVGRADQREARLKMADYLEWRAKQLEEAPPAEVPTEAAD
jgi:hypothetical protein